MGVTMDISKHKFVCPECGREYINPAQQSIRRQKDANEDKIYIICTTDKHFAFPVPLKDETSAIIGEAIIGKAIIQ